MYLLELSAVLCCQQLIDSQRPSSRSMRQALLKNF